MKDDDDTWAWWAWWVWWAYWGALFCLWLSVLA